MYHREHAWMRLFRDDGHELLNGTVPSCCPDVNVRPMFESNGLHLLDFVIVGGRLHYQDFAQKEGLV
jgi:hypothetical protein